ncbi:hypothetical protein LTR94_032549, partial [Friedmanniomyces endolithicus]
ARTKLEAGSSGPIELIARATPKRHYYLQSRAGNRLFELALGPIALALCSASDPDRQKQIDRLLDEHGRDGFTASFLRARGLDWAAALLAGFEAVPAADVGADPVATARPTPRDPYADHIAEAAQRFELPAAWIKAVLRAESNGDPRAVSPKGAIGLMQIMPAAAT